MGDEPNTSLVAPGEGDLLTSPPQSQIPLTNAKSFSVLRSICAWFLVFVACLAIPLSVTLWWAVQTIDNQTQFVSTLSPLARDKSIQSFVTNKVTDKLISVAETSGVPLIVPAEAMRPVIHTQVAEVVASPAFPGIWSTALRESHPTIDAALRGNQILPSNISLNLTPVGLAAVSNLHAQGNTAFDKIVAAKGQPQVVIKILPSAKLHKVHAAFNGLLTLEWLLPVIALAAFIGAILVANVRRRILLGLAIGTTLISLATIVLFEVARTAIVSNVQQGGSQREAVGSAYDALIRYLRFDFILVLVVGVVLGVGVVVWAVVDSRRSRSVSVN